MRAAKSGARRVYSDVDATIVHAVASMQRAGLNADNGFGLDELTMYAASMERLIDREITRFAEVMGALPRDQVLGLARAGLEGTNALLIGLRRRIFLDLLDRLGAEGQDDAGC